MKRFFKENFALAAGIALPLILILLFMLAGQTARVAVDNPEYDAVFAVNYNHNVVNNPYKIGIDRGDIVISYDPAKNENNTNYYQKPRLFIFDHETLYAKQLDIDVENRKNNKVVDPDLIDLNEQRIDPDPVSPDGYKFEYDYRSHGGLFGELFGFGYRHRSYYALKKNTRSISIDGPEAFYQAHFIGWIHDE